MSKLAPITEIEEKYVEAELEHKKRLAVRSCAPLSWYLSEERLELQLWVTFSPDDPGPERPCNRDKLIGSAYLDLASLADSRRRQHRVRSVACHSEAGCPFVISSWRCSVVIMCPGINNCVSESFCMQWCVSTVQARSCQFGRSVCESPCQPETKYSGLL